MAKEAISFEQFMEKVEPNYQAFIKELNDYLTENGCKVTIEEKKNGYLASYKHTKLKKTILNKLFRKNGMFIRIYGDNAEKYLDFLNSMPEEMKTAIDKSPQCKRLVENGCNPKCIGYDIVIDEKRHQKCRYSCYQFLVSDENNPYIKSFVENEVAQRLAG